VNLLDLMNELGSRARYGVSPADKYKMMISGTIPGQPKPFLPGGADLNPDAERYASNYLGSQQWGQAPADVFNKIRYLLDSNDTAFDSGLKGAQAGATGTPLKTLMATLASGGLPR
jgi:hypothetical protein